ncbi:MAG: hypothetical protein FJ316_09215 [SAR202 cluster bacterium]|nr:hypothetical protein [SAR202 cluster bacterium]
MTLTRGQYGIIVFKLALPFSARNVAAGESMGIPFAEDAYITMHTAHFINHIALYANRGA